MGNDNSKLDKCPSSESLANFLVGNLIDPVICGEIGKHLENCTGCVQRLAQVDTSTNPLVASLQRGSLRSTKQADSPGDENCNDALQRVLEIGNSPAIDSQDLSTANVSEQTVASEHQQKKKRDQFDSMTIGSYQLIEQIGAGGMGVVYKAKHTKLDRLVGIKLLSKDRFENDQAKRRFEREMQAIGRLKHPNIVASHDAGESDGYSFLTMELLNGIDLSELVKQRSDSVKVSDACELIRQAAIGLQYAHEHGIVHRDVKPSNIMLCDVQNPIVKLLDLGLARFEQPDPTQESMTSINQMMGTIDYMPPEQCLDSRDVDARSDVYSLGATLFFLLVGRAPWAGENHQTQGKKLKALLSEQLGSIASVRSDLPDELVSIVDRCLKRDPNDRFQDVGEMIAALEPLCKGHDLASLIGEAQILESTALAAGFSSPEIPAASAVCSKPRAKTVSNQPPGLTKWLMLGMLPIGFLLAGIIWLKLTDGGYIRIEADPSIQVTVGVLQDGKQIDTVEIGQGKDTYWYRSGQYEIRIADDGDQDLTVVGETLVIARGSREVVRIEKRAKKELAYETVDGAKKLADRSTPLSRIDFSPTELAPYEILTSPEWEWTEPEHLGSHINNADIARDIGDSSMSSDGLSMALQHGNHVMLWTRESTSSPFQKMRRFRNSKAMAWGPSLSNNALVMFLQKGNSIHEFRREGRNDLFGEGKRVTKGMCPCVFRNGLGLLFSSNRAKGHGGWDLWMMTRDSLDDPFEAPVNLGSLVNFPGDQQHCTLSSDERVLIYDSRPTKRLPAPSLWMATRADTKSPFGKPIPLSKLNNQSNPLDPDPKPVGSLIQQEAAPTLVAGGRALIFKSYRPGGYLKSDLWISRRVPKKLND